MIKKLIKFILSLILTISIVVVYLSYFGINTKKLNKKIKSEVLKINKEANLELKSVQILLNIRNLTLNIKTLEPEIFLKNSRLKLEYIKTNVSLKSFINKDFSIDDLQISTKEINLNDLILLTRSFKNSAELFILNKIIKEGYLVGDINLNFDKNGKIKSNYEINGLIKKVKLNILNKYTVNNLSFAFNIKDKEYIFKDLDGVFNQIRLSSPSIKVREKNNQFLVNGKLLNKKNDQNNKVLIELLENNFKDNGIKSISFSSDNNFTFSFNKKFKISNFNIESKINLEKLIYKKKLDYVKKYLPSFKNIVKLENHKILISFKKNKFNIKGKGEMSISNKIDYLNYKLNKINDNYDFKTTVNINNNQILLDILDYQKKENLNSTLYIKGSYKKNKKITFDNISLKDDDKNNFMIEGLNLDNKLKIEDIDKLELNFINNNKIKNQIFLKKDKKKYKISGESFDVSKLIDNILDNGKKTEPSSIFKNFNFNIDINKTYLDKDAYVNNLTGFIIFKNNKLNRLSLDSVFSNKRKLNLTINTNKNKEKVTTLFSDYPKPIVKRYKFIKGFEEGVLDFYSIKKENITNSTLIIDNFKVQEVPVLAKLLTLASLQGIADLLTGEGIRFTDLEMKFTNKIGLMTIEEMYAIGPAISILMEGYIETNKLISLRGTLVPATTINRSIASIPLIGKILVGKKTGEGVFGVSFKVKGPPKNLKTTVNPIKTLTPRFITRTLEKIKKN
ncbi:AsmA-like C-terminal region-containing protein [Candidatus Pelagibacter sp.]|nr:AsmA-like C-terminal region-containing protein [Candidatus Pelagibacter sp.]